MEFAIGMGFGMFVAYIGHRWQTARLRRQLNEVYIPPSNSGFDKRSK